MWQMNDIRSRAIAQLSSCATPTAKIVYGRAYDHPPWLRDGYLALCLRSKPLTVEEVEELSLKEIIGVAEARERIRSRVLFSSCETEWVWDNGRQVMQYETHYKLPNDEHHGESDSRPLLLYLSQPESTLALFQIF